MSHRSPCDRFVIASNFCFLAATSDGVGLQVPDHTKRLVKVINIDINANITRDFRHRSAIAADANLAQCLAIC